MTEEYLSRILAELKDEQKELLFLWAVRLMSSTKIAGLRGQTDRNIRKVRTTMMKIICGKVLAALREKAERGEAMTLQERRFLMNNALDDKQDSNI